MLPNPNTEVFMLLSVAKAMEKISLGGIFINEKHRWE